VKILSCTGVWYWQKIWE